MSALTDFRQEKDAFYKNSRQSPLTAAQRKVFTGLAYYPETASLRLELPLERLPHPKTVVLATSTGEDREYSQAGQVRFTVGAEQVALQVYESEDGSFFLPFVDATAPTETYGAGRYLDPQEVRPGILLVDFNLAYNPYCAYNERWSCPLPPAENRLSVRLEAGEKNLPLP
jgi:uncharacterized protein (DUF1684 family)